jgi:hypothetical protein
MLNNYDRKRRDLFFYILRSLLGPRKNAQADLDFRKIR